MRTVFMTSFEAKPVLEEALKSMLTEKESYDEIERKIESLKTSYIKLFGKEEFDKFLKANGLTK